MLENVIYEPSKETEISTVITAPWSQHEKKNFVFDLVGNMVHLVSDKHAPYRNAIKIDRVEINV